VRRREVAVVGLALIAVALWVGILVGHFSIPNGPTSRLPATNATPAPQPVPAPSATPGAPGSSGTQGGAVGLAVKGAGGGAADVEDDAPPNDVEDEPQVTGGSVTVPQPGFAVLGPLPAPPPAKINTPTVAPLPVPSGPPIR
jgi:hypothetical protein